MNEESITHHLTNHFETIIGHAIVGYMKCDQIERLLLEKVEAKQTSPHDMNENPTLLTYYHCYATTISQGKKYFFAQLIELMQQKEVLYEYIDIMNSMKDEKDEKDDNTIQDNKDENAIQDKKIQDNKDEKKDEKDEKDLEQLFVGGGLSKSLAQLFLNIVFMTMIVSINNASNVGNALSKKDMKENVEDVEDVEDVEAFIDVQINKQLYSSGVRGILNTRNDSQMEQFGLEYANIGEEFPPEELVSSENITQKYHKIDNTFANKWLELFGNNAKLDKLFTNKVHEKVAHLNGLVQNTHEALRQMCANFAQRTDPLLPIPLYELMNMEIQKKQYEIVKQAEEIIHDTTIALKEDYPKPPDESVLSNILHFFDWSYLRNDIRNDIKNDIRNAEATTQLGLNNADLQEIYDKAEQSIKNEIQQLTPHIVDNVIQQTKADIYNHLQAEQHKAQTRTNLKIYLSSICKFKMPKYTFNESSGQIQVINLSKSRFHLMIQANNVVSYYDKIKNEPAIMEDTDRAEQLESLFQKSMEIIMILKQYDENIVNSLSDGNDYSVDQFFESIGQLWINLKTPIVDTTEQMFPQSYHKKQMEMFHLEQAHLEQMKERINELRRNNEINLVAEQEWDTFNRYFGINIEQMLKTVTLPVKGVVNATSSLGANVIENIGVLANTGMTSIHSIVWAIVMSGMLFMIPAIGYLSIKSGFVSAVFHRATQKLLLPLPTPALPNVEQPLPNVEQPLTNVEQPLTNVEQPLTNVEQPLTNVEQPPITGGKRKRKTRRVHGKNGKNKNMQRTINEFVFIE